MTDTFRGGALDWCPLCFAENDEARTGGLLGKTGGGTRNRTRVRV